ncbi:hypothetical protein QZH41_019447 [Actinostola sp. cb2023]|nr:hypothetical protein QZH41_019447 [Actinostola sp. cb2023]
MADSNFPRGKQRFVMGSPVSTSKVHLIFINRNQTMGYDAGRFQGEVDEELMCSICGGVLEDPLQGSIM